MHDPLRAQERGVFHPLHSTMSTHEHYEITLTAWLINQISTMAALCVRNEICKIAKPKAELSQKIGTIKQLHNRISIYAPQTTSLNRPITSDSLQIHLCYTSTFLIFFQRLEQLFLSQGWSHYHVPPLSLPTTSNQNNCWDMRDMNWDDFLSPGDHTPPKLELVCRCSLTQDTSI